MRFSRCRTTCLFQPRWRRRHPGIFWQPSGLRGSGFSSASRQPTARRRWLRSRAAHSRKPAMASRSPAPSARRSSFFRASCRGSCCGSAARRRSVRGRCVRSSTTCDSSGAPRAINRRRPVAGKKSGYNLERSVEILGSRICITDRITGPGGDRPAVGVTALVRLPGRSETIPPLTLASQSLTVLKTLDFAAGDAMTFSCQVKPEAGGLG